MIVFFGSLNIKICLWTKQVHAKIDTTQKPIGDKLFHRITFAGFILKRKRQI